MSEVEVRFVTEETADFLRLDRVGTVSQIAEELSLPPVKIHCSVLAEDAIKSAIEDYKKKRSAREALSEPPRTTSSAEGRA